ncbi:MAG: hypothetical protein J0H01_19720 [Rhizobiales bacterium]|nr:hypothetical protein [Hyphomicrobiales bacterium]
MNDPRNTFSTSEIADPAALKAHAALYGALDSAGREEPVVVVARPRTIPQGGAAVVRDLRARLIAEMRAEAATRNVPPAASPAVPRVGADTGPVVLDTAGLFNRPAGEGPFSSAQPEEGASRAAIPRAAILRFRLSELPKLAGHLTGRGGEVQGRDNGREIGRETGRVPRSEPER